MTSEDRLPAWTVTTPLDRLLDIHRVRQYFNARAIRMAISMPLFFVPVELDRDPAYVPIASTLRYGVSIFTYCDQVTFGITGDRASTADIDVLARGVTHSRTELVLQGLINCGHVRVAGQRSRGSWPLGASSQVAQRSVPVVLAAAGRRAAGTLR